MSDTCDNKSNNRSFPILYLTGRRSYRKVLTKADCTELKLWNEFKQENSIKNVLMQWQSRQPHAKQLKNIIPFRMVLHKTNRMNLSYLINKETNQQQNNEDQQEDQEEEKEILLSSIKSVQNKPQLTSSPSKNKLYSPSAPVSSSFDRDDDKDEEEEIYGKEKVISNNEEVISESFESKCKYIALIWVPSNKETGLNDNEYNELIMAFRKSKYFCNKLNKQCIYISGPKYEPHHQTKQNHYFNIKSLRDRCQQALNDDVLSIDIVVHEFVIEKDDEKQSGKKDNKHYSWDIMTNDKGQSFRKILNASLAPSNEKSKTYKQMVRDNSDLGTSLLSANGDNGTYHDDEKYGNDEEKVASNIKLSMQPLVERRSTIDELDASSKLTARKTHAFAFVWFKIGNECQDQPELDAYGVLSALSVMYKLHKQPCGDSRDGLVNVELMGYDECYQNLNLTVDTYRSGSWKDGSVVLTLLVIVQCIFLPFFVLIPPISIITFFNSNFKIKPRYRPTNDTFDENLHLKKPNRSDAFKNLDRTEQIPYDISAIWRSFRFDKQQNDKNLSKWGKVKKMARKFRNFILSLILNGIVYGGPVLYRGYEYDERSNGVEDLGFFDCFGPLIFYGLWMCTIIVWSCIPRGAIGPKEHLLLYHKMIAQRPKKKRKPTDDFAALTYISQPSIITTFNYAQRKGFLEVRTPTHELLSKRRIKCCGKSCCDVTKIVLLFGTAVIMYFGAQNLENFQEAHQPFYVDKYNEDINHYWLRDIYGIVSNVTSWFMLCSLILLWETMMDRIKRQNNNLKDITNLIVRNTYSEYITFNHVDNRLSWLTLGDFIKRKGMMLFASLETPVFSLWILSLISWMGTIFCIFGGVGLKWKTDNSLFSNSALATWFFLALVSIFYMARLLRYGQKFNHESEKQELAVRTQCRTIDNENELQFSKHEELSLEEINAIQSSERLLKHMKDHSEIVPKIFGVKFDKLTAKAAWMAVFSAVPTIVSYVISEIKND